MSANRVKMLRTVMMSASAGRSPSAIGTPRYAYRRKGKDDDMSRNKCGCGKKDCGICGCKKKDCCPTTPLLFFYELLASSAGTVTTAITPTFPIGDSIRFGTLAVSIDAPAAAGSTLTVQLLRNGVVVPNAFVTFGNSSPTSGTQRVRFGQTFSAGDTLSLQAIQTGPFAGPTQVAVSLTPR